MLEDRSSPIALPYPNKIKTSWGGRNWAAIPYPLPSNLMDKIRAIPMQKFDSKEVNPFNFEPFTL